METMNGHKIILVAFVMVMLVRGLEPAKIPVCGGIGFTLLTPDAIDNIISTMLIIRTDGDDDHQRIICSGILVHQSHTLTSANCVRPKR